MEYNIHFKLLANPHPSKTNKYLYCNNCRNKTLEVQKKYKEKAKEEYNEKKVINLLHCDCGISYVCFRDYHLYRHIKSKKHKKIMEGGGKTNDNLKIQ